MDKEMMKSDEAAQFILKEILNGDMVFSSDKDAIKLAIEGIFRAGVLAAMMTVCPPEQGKTYMLPRFWVSKEDLIKAF